MGPVFVLSMERKLPISVKDRDCIFYDGKKEDREEGPKIPRQPKKRFRNQAQ